MGAKSHRGQPNDLIDVTKQLFTDRELIVEVRLLLRDVVEFSRLIPARKTCQIVLMIWSDLRFLH